VESGELPLALQALDPRLDPRLAAGVGLPEHIARWRSLRR
jgi:hypothetical protein